MAPVIQTLTREENEVKSILVTTSQHKEMLTPFLKLFQLSPDFDLQVMKKRQTLPGITHRTVSGLEKVLSQVSPDFVLVQGDTTSAMAAALTAFYMKIPVGHVEAGLRSMDTLNPYPEEMNRTLISRLATLHFAPTDHSVDNLIKEGVSTGITKTGNTIVDALKTLLNSSQAPTEKNESASLLGEGKYILVTAHRRENLGESMKNICTGLKKIANNFPEIRIIFPVHMNPLVQDVVHAELNDVKNILLLKPLGYLEFIRLMQNSLFIISDSGGVQEEAPSLGKPVLVMRDNTERPEGIIAGAAKLVGTEPETIFRSASKLILDSAYYNSMATHKKLYGDGKASERIFRAAIKYLQNTA